MKSFLFQISFLLLPLAAPSIASAAIEFIEITDEAGEQAFADAVERMDLLTGEAFAAHTLSPGDAALLDGPVLAPGQSTGPFPSGTPEPLGLIFQVNTLGSAPASPSPG